MGVAMLVLIMLPGLTVSAFSANLLLSFELCIGRRGRRIWVILGFFFELLILFDQWAGHKLLSENVTGPHVGANHPISFPSVPVSEGIEIRHGCQFISSVVRALAKLRGGLGKFLPCGTGSHMSGRETVRVTKVNGHATVADVEQGRVRLEDQLGNAEADTAADLGRRHQSELLMDARRSLLKVRTHWYPVMQKLHRFMIAVSRVAVNRDGKGGVEGRCVGLISGLMSILLLFLAAWFLEWALDAGSRGLHYRC